MFRLFFYYYVYVFFFFLMIRPPPRSTRTDTLFPYTTLFRSLWRLAAMKLKLGPIVDDKPVKVTLELPASLHRDLTAYAEALGREESHALVDPVKLIVPMLERFISSDRAFAKSRRSEEHTSELQSLMRISYAVCCLTQKYNQ